MVIDAAAERDGVYRSDHLLGRYVGLVLTFAVFGSACGLSSSRAVVIEWTTIHQTIDGFGAATNETSFVRPLSDREMDFFYTTSGLGYSLLRIRDYPSTSECESDSAAG